LILIVSHSSKEKNIKVKPVFILQITQNEFKMFFSGSESSIKLGREVIKNLYYFEEAPMLDCNQFIISNKNHSELALFDSGNGRSFKGLIEGMKKLGLNYRNITKVFLTHEHVDHVLGLYTLKKILKDNPPEIYAFGETADILRGGIESKIFPGNLGINPSMFGLEIIPLEVNKINVNDTIKIWSDFAFQIYHTPGHSQGSICYYDSINRILIPGDLVFTGGSFGRYDFPGGSLDALIQSIKFVNNLDVKYLLPGHMGISHNGNQQIDYSFKMVQSIKTFF
jgi:glyoxylase-like metal-dependent hydrolase (beta-lactamase superfamily II)